MCIKCRVVGEECPRSKGVSQDWLEDEKRHSAFREATKGEINRHYTDSSENPGEVVAAIADLEILSADLVDILEKLENRLSPVLPSIPTPVNELRGDTLMDASTPLGQRLSVLSNRCTRSIVLVRSLLENLQV